MQGVILLSRCYTVLRRCEGGTVQSTTIGMASPTKKGTDGGGCIEIYANSADAKKRDDFFTKSPTFLIFKLSNR
jgi:hypothetical protein